VPASLGYFSTGLNATIYATAVDSQGNMYVTGNAGSGLPTTPGAYQTTGSGAFVAKLSPTGAVLYASYLGSGGTATGIAVGAAGDAYVLSEGGSVATTANAIASTTSGNEDYVAELNPTGSALNYATYLPGTIDGASGTWTLAGAIALDGSGNIYVAGYAGSGLPVTAGAYQSTPVGGDDAFFMKINPTLSGAASVIYASYLGGSSGMDAATGIAVDGSGNAYLEGFAGSGFPTTPGAFQTTFGGPALNDVFVAKFDPALSGTASLVYSTYLGGTSTLYEEHWGAGYVPNINDAIVVSEMAGGIAVDSAGNAYVTSATNFTNFPTTQGAYQTTINNQPTPQAGFPACDAFVTKLNATGSALVYSTYLGGTNGSSGTSTGGAGVAVDANGDAFVAGWTNSTSFPTMNPVQATNGTGGFDSFVTELNPAGSGLLFSTYLGGSSGNGWYDGYGIGLDSAGNIYVGGEITSSPRNYPTGGFAAQINLAPSPSFAVTGFPSSTTAGVAQTITVTALNANGTVNTGYTGTVQFTSSDPQAVLPPNYTFTAADQGVHTFSATLKTAGTQSITATDTTTGSITGTESGIAVNPAAAASLSITGLPSSVKAGSAYTFTVTAYDPYGNTASGYRGAVHFTSSDQKAKLPSNYTFTSNDNGSHTFTNGVTFQTLGTQTLTATDTATGTITGTATVQVVKKRTAQPATGSTPSAGAANASSPQTGSATLISPLPAGSGTTTSPDADPSESSSVASLWQQADALALQRLDALWSLEAGAMGVTKDTLMRDLLFVSNFSSNAV
jgi:hypothetical protein